MKCNLNQRDRTGSQWIKNLFRHVTFIGKLLNLGGVNLENRFSIILLLLMFIFASPIKAFAANSAASNIILDGNFDDWSDKPFVSDVKQNEKSPWLDILKVGYFSDKQYLYLKVERLSANKSEPWHFNVVVLNAIKGQKQLQYPFGQSKSVYAPQFDISTNYSGNKSNNGAIVNVSFNRENIESTFSASSNGKEIEFRIPLAKVGLDGLNKEIQFMLKSDVDPKTGEIDWVPNARPIIITTGPTFWQLSSIVCFIAVSFITYRIYKNRNESA